MSTPVAGNDPDAPPPGRAESGRGTGRRLRGLVLEGLVIVASILLAFAIDAAWDQQRDRKQEERLLEQLVGELDLYIRLGPVARQSAERVESDVTLLLDAIHGSERLDDRAWQRALLFLDRSYQFSAATPVFDRLTTEDGFNAISDPEVRKLLADVASYLGVARRFEELQDQFLATQMSPWLNRNVDRYAAQRANDEDGADRPASRFDPGFDALRSRELSNLLIERRKWLYLVTMFRSQARERMEGLREVLTD